MTRREQLAALLVILVLPLGSCSKNQKTVQRPDAIDGETSQSTVTEQEAARRALEQRRISYTQEEFFRCIESGDATAVRLFLVAGMSPDTISDRSLSPLPKAALFGRADIVRLLLEHGADVNAKGDDGSTALTIAIQNDGHIEIVNALLDRGADPNARLRDGRTALILAAHDPPIVRALLEKGADPSLSEEIRGETALKRAVNADEIDSVKALLTYGADVNTKDVDGYSALMAAAGRGQAGIVKLLLTKGVDVDARDKDGWTALMGAAADGNLVIVRALVASGADVNAEDKDRKTPLKLAKEKKHKEIIAYLEKAGAKR